MAIPATAFMQPSTIQGGSAASMQPNLEESSFLMDRVGMPLLSGLGMAGNLIDLPFSMIRDTASLLTGNENANPFDQLMTPLSHENRTTGRNLLTQWGIAPENKETGMGGWIDDPSEGLWDLAGFGTELLMSPTAAWTAPVKAAGAVARPIAKGIGGLSFGGRLGTHPFSGIQNTIGSLASGARDQFRGLMVPKFGGSTVPELARNMPEHTAGIKASQQAAHEVVSPLVSQLERAGLNEAQMGKLRPYLEKIAGSEKVLPEKIEKLLDSTHEVLKEIRISMKEAGLPHQELEDVIKFFPRRMGHGVKQELGAKGQNIGTWHSGHSAGPLSPTSAADVRRNEILKGFLKGSREGVDELFTDTGIKQIISQNKPQKDTVEEIAEFIRTNYGDDIVEEFHAVDDQGQLLFDAVDGSRKGMSISRTDAEKFGEVVEYTDETVEEFTDEVLTEAMELWKDEQPIRDFQKSKLGSRNIARGEGDIQNLPASGDELYLAYEDMTGIRPPGANTREMNDYAYEELRRKLMPKPTKDSALVKERVQQLLDMEGPHRLPEGTIKYQREEAFGRGVQDPLYLKPKHGNRYEELAKMIFKNPVLQDTGIFTNNVADDLLQHLTEKGRQLQVASTLKQTLANPKILKDPLIRGERGTSIGDILKNARIDGDVGSRHIMEMMGNSMEGVTKKHLQNFRAKIVRPDVADEIARIFPTEQLPKEMKGFLRAFDSYTSMFKAGVLTWPARYARDLVSGAVRNFENGMFSVPSAIDAYKVTQGQTIRDIARAPAVVAWFKKTRPGGDDLAGLTDDVATDIVREMYSSGRASRAHMRSEDLLEPGTVAPIVEQMPGLAKPSMQGFVKTAMGSAEEGADLIPTHIRGMWDPAEQAVRDTSTFGPAAAGEMLGSLTDDVNRMTGLIHQLRRGEMDTRGLMNRINRMQVDYSADAFTAFEQSTLKRIFPFYSFSSRQFPYVAQELMSKPTGTLSKILRASAASGSQSDPSTPDYVAQTTSASLGTLPDGSKRYLAGLGLMHEDVGAFMGGGVRGAGMEALSRLNPILKAPLEWFTGESFFQRGPLGGRNIEDLNPTVGQTIANVRETITGEKTEDIKPFISPGFEHLVANSPLARFASTARTAFDPRKREQGGIALPLNLLTGLRISDISPASQEATIRERASGVAREELGANVFETIYITKDVIEKTRETNPELADRMEAFNELRNHLNASSRARRAAREAE